MSINITDEISAAFKRYEREVIDYDFVGNPITRAAVGCESIVTFAAGYQSAKIAQTTRIAELERDTLRLNWIIDNCTINGGGRGFDLYVFIPVDCEDVKTAIDAAINKEALID